MIKCMRILQKIKRNNKNKDRNKNYKIGIKMRLIENIKQHR